MTVQQFELKSKTEDISAEKSEMFNRLGELKAQLASMQQKIDKLSQDRE